MYQEWIGVGVSLLFFGVGLSFFGHAMMIKFRGLEITAKVIAVHKCPGPDDTTFKPEFEFICDNNSKISHLHGKRVLSEIGRNPPAHSVGDYTKVFYLEKANRVISNKEWGWTSVLGIVLTFFGLYGYATSYPH